jgi:hypothetical protein
MFYNGSLRVTIRVTRALQRGLSPKLEFKSDGCSFTEMVSREVVGRGTAVARWRSRKES